MPKRFLSERIVVFTVPGRPLCSGNYGNKQNSDGIGTGFKGGARTYGNLIRYMALQAKLAEGWECDDAPVYVVLTLYLATPYNIKADKRKAMLKNKDYLCNRVPKISRIVSVILKAMEGTVYKEEKNVVSLLVAKKYDTNQRVEVLVGKPKNFKEMAYDIRNA